MTAIQSPTVRIGRPVAVGLVVALVVAVSADAGGGPSWLLSPAIWGLVLICALIILVVAQVKGHLVRSTMLGLPILIGGTAAIAMGAWDYVPWMTSPAVWLGIAASTVVGLWFIRAGSARPRDVVVGILVGLLVFGILLISVLAGIVAFWMGG